MGQSHRADCNTGAAAKLQRNGINQRRVLIGRTRLNDDTNGHHKEKSGEPSDKIEN
jgi:hypothetical protein